MPVIIDLSGRTFGKWTVIQAAKKNAAGKMFWLCRCECGVEKEVNGKHLRDGGSKQCRGCAHRTHGGTGKRKPTTEYVIWASMLARCENPSAQRYEDYGGRGIKVCERWHDFENFLADVGRRPDGKSLDRYPNQNGNYEPGNVRWATSTEQNRNRRDNRIVTAFGKSMCVAEWAECLGVKRELIRDRLRRGWEPERALSVFPINGPSYT